MSIESTNVPLLTWPETEIGETSVVPCPCGSLNDLGVSATRSCNGDFNGPGTWGTEESSSCRFDEFTLQLCMTTQVSVYCTC